MLYKTIVLELIQQYPEWHDQLCRSRQMLPTLESQAKALKTRHDFWKQHLNQAKPRRDPMQVASEALEIARQELENNLPRKFPRGASEPLSLEAAMAFVRKHTPPA